MTIKLLKDSTEQEKPRVNMLPFIFEYHQDLIDNFMPEIGNILNLCIPEMGMIVGEGVDSILTVYNLADVLKNRVWPWKETIFNHCHKILIKNKLGDDETMLTNSLCTISILIDLFEEKMENLVSSPGFIDLILHFLFVISSLFLTESIKMNKFNILLLLFWLEFQIIFLRPSFNSSLKSRFSVGNQRI
jgi:hypothetical protein